MSGPGQPRTTLVRCPLRWPGSRYPQSDLTQALKPCRGRKGPSERLLEEPWRDINLQLHPKLHRSVLCLSLSQPTGVWAARDELRSIIKEHRRGDQEKRRYRHRKTYPKEVSPSGQPLGNAGRAALEGQAGADWPGTEISGQLAKVACSLGRLACGGRSAGLTYLSHPRNGREGYYLPPSGATHCPEPRAGAACGAETQGLTANRRSAGADQEGSPAFSRAFIPPAAFQVQDRRGEGRWGRK